LRYNRLREKVGVCIFGCISWRIEMLKNIKIKMISFLYKVLKPAIKVPFGLLLRLYFAKKLKFELDKVNRILILPAYNGLGDNIMISYYVHDLLNSRENLEVYIISPHHNFWKALDYENINTIRPPKSRLELLRILRANNKSFDLVIFSSPFTRYLKILPLIKARYKICYDPLDFAFRRPKLRVLGNINVKGCSAYDLRDSFYGESLGNLLRCCGFVVKEKIPKLRNIDDYKLFSQKTVILFAYSRDELRKIPDHFWINLCHNIIQSGYEVLILYDDEAQIYSQKLIASLNNAVKGIYTDSIEKTVQTLNSAYAVICPDGVLLHLSILSKVKKIVAFFTIVEPKHRIPEIAYKTKKIKTIKIEGPRLKNIISRFSVFDSSSMFEYYSRLRDFYFEAYKEEKDRLIKENEKKNILTKSWNF
jgi:ADP-heptose:LPS heptosyltransferase